VLPKLDSGFGHAGAHYTGVLVPEAPMNEDDLSAAWEYDVRAA
jgi:hypothetical protein